MTITGQATPRISAYFNKGIVAAQWVSRALGQTTQEQQDQGARRASPPTRCGTRSVASFAPRFYPVLADAKKKNGKLSPPSTSSTTQS